MWSGQLTLFLYLYQFMRKVQLRGGTGEAICRRLLHESDAHAQMPLPTSALYVQDVKAEVLLLFDRKPTNETPWRGNCGSTTCTPTRASR